VDDAALPLVIFFPFLSLLSCIACYRPLSPLSFSLIHVHYQGVLKKNLLHWSQQKKKKKSLIVDMNNDEGEREGKMTTTSTIHRSPLLFSFSLCIS
jgi:hypothetical protein